MEENPYKAPAFNRATAATSIQPARRVSMGRLFCMAIGGFVGGGAGFLAACVASAYIVAFLWPTSNDTEGGRHAQLQRMQTAQGCIVITCPIVSAVIGAMAARTLHDIVLPPAKLPRPPLGSRKLVPPA